MIVVAKSTKGHEFCYSAKSAHKVPKTSADIICNALNESNYNLYPGEVWFIHEVGPYDTAYAYAECQAFARRNGKVVRRSYYSWI